MVSVLLDSQPVDLCLPHGAASLKDVEDAAAAALGPHWYRWDVGDAGDVKAFSGAISDVSPLPVAADDDSNRRRRRLLLAPRPSSSSHAVDDADTAQPGLPDDSGSLLAFTSSNTDEPGLPAEQLPASLALGGFWQLKGRTDAQVRVVLPGMEPISWAIRRGNSTGAALKASVAELLGCPASRVVLLTAGRDELGQGELQEAIMQPGRRIWAVPLVGDSEDRGNSMQVFVRGLDNQTKTLRVSPDMSIFEVMRKVETVFGVPPSIQHLMYGGSDLPGFDTLAGRNITKESTLHLVLALRGGMFHHTSGREGNFDSLQAGPQGEGKVVAARGRVPVEVVLPDGDTVLLDCDESDGADAVLTQLRPCLAQRALLAADVDTVSDVGTLRSMLRQAQAALRAAAGSQGHGQI